MNCLLVDNFDSFTHILADYIRQLKIECTVLRCDDEKLNDAAFVETFDRIVLSPGPGKPGDEGYSMQLIEKYHQSKPILGICLGHQALGIFFGAKLRKAKEPMHGITSKINCAMHPLFEGLPEQFEVMRYHSLVIDDLGGTGLQPIAQTIDDGEIMAIQHESLPLTGIQFHPESILTEHGLQLLANWFSMGD